MKNAPRKNAGLSSICGYCKAPLDTLEQTKMATPKRKASGSNPDGNATQNRLKAMLSGGFYYSCHNVSGD